MGGVAEARLKATEKTTHHVRESSDGEAAVMSAASRLFDARNVEQILGRRVDSSGGEMFLVKTSKSFGSEATWEPRANVLGEL